ncbi:ArpU family phage packaging/lysis transcriptional regulator [Bacillus subtilis]|uniref:ArpU family phage packaging/lysis transcriptional regulator n=1 Tax=Bacillus subtilis TaxID=1423 RepID=UPI0024A6BAB6|nr:ArpU family phage packaging/lysis transcriptional regulator [Bacillus subtilis]
MLAEQITLFSPIDMRKVAGEVIKELKNYRNLKIQQQNKQEQKDAAVIGLFPSLGNRDQQRINELKVKQIDRALENCLDELQLQIVQMKYLSPKQRTDTEIYMELGIKSDKFYILKKTAIVDIATALGMI